MALSMKVARLAGLTALENRLAYLRQEGGRSGRGEVQAYWHAAESLRRRVRCGCWAGRNTSSHFPVPRALPARACVSMHSPATAASVACCPCTRTHGDQGSFMVQPPMATSTLRSGFCFFSARVSGYSTSTSFHSMGLGEKSAGGRAARLAGRSASRARMHTAYRWCSDTSPGSFGAPATPSSPSFMNTKLYTAWVHNVAFNCRGVHRHGTPPTEPERYCRRTCQAALVLEVWMLPEARWQTAACTQCSSAAPSGRQRQAGGERRAGTRGQAAAGAS